MRGGGRTPFGVGPDTPVCAQRVLKTRPRRATILLSLATSGRHSAENTALPGRLTHSLFVKLRKNGSTVHTPTPRRPQAGHVRVDLGHKARAFRY